MGQYRQAFYAGLITLADLENAIASYYPNPIDQQVILLEDLLGQTRYEIAQDKLAAEAAKYGITIPVLPKL